jgi:hypothetical protein
MNERRMSFKVDVDTHDGMKAGVPRLLKVFQKFSVKATFFLSFGPDNSGKAIYNILRQKGFLKKMLRTKAPKLYGWRTILSGTLLPARPIAIAFPDLVREIRKSGHEVAVHAWDHRYFQDHLPQMSEPQISEEFAKSFEAFEKILGDRPQAMAAPGWQVTPLSLKVQDSLGLLYASDIRYGIPLFPKFLGYSSTTLQIPTTTRCLEELIAMSLRKEEEWEEAIWHDLSLVPHPVFPVHAVVEGGLFYSFFERLLPKLLKLFPQVVTLGEYARELLSQTPLPQECTIRLASLPGRGELVASGEREVSI